MRLLLGIIFSVYLLTMLAMTIRASLACSILEVPAVVLEDAWFQATLTDAYLGFLTFYVWVAYRESTWLGRSVWLLLILTLGNMAMSAYVLVRLWRLPPDAPLANLLIRPTDGAKCEN